MTARLDARLADLKAQGRAGFVPFIMAGDPSEEATLALLHALPDAGADIIELGMPFSDPVADGPTIQAAGLRALAGGMSLRKTLALVAQFRATNNTTPLILMGYYNPLLHYGLEAFAADAATAGVDGLIIVDVPPEEATPLSTACAPHALALVRLIAPPSVPSRLPLLAQGASGFVYYISIKGITGTASADASQVKDAVAQIRTHIKLPVAVGFGINTPEDVARTAQYADLVVVGSAIVKTIEQHANKAPADIAHHVSQLCTQLSSSLRT